MTQATTPGSKPPLVCHGHTRPVPELNFRQAILPPLYISYHVNVFEAIRSNPPFIDA